MDAGRNDPCPCGSGKKYKKCCQAGVADLMAEAARRTRRMQDHIEPRILRFASALLGEEALDAAAAEFVGAHNVDLDGPEVQLFYPWLIYDWIPRLPGGAGHKGSAGRGGSTGSGANCAPIALLYLDRHAADLSREELTFVRAVCAAPVSFHDVLEVEPGRRLRLRDALLHAEQEVYEESASETLREGDILFARVVGCEGVALLIGSGSIALPPREKGAILRLREMVRKRADPSSPELLRKLEPELRMAYLEIRDRLLNPPTPIMTNTDGDLIEFHTITCEIASAGAAFDALKSLAKGETEEDLRRGASFDPDGRLRKVEFDWLKSQSSSRTPGQATVLGQIRLDGTTLEIEVNSAKRARKIQDEIRKRLGATARKLTMRIRPFHEAMEDHKRRLDTPEERKRQEKNEALQAAPEVQEAMRAFLERHWDGWPHEGLPALGGKTPLQAMKTADGREMVESLLLDFERSKPIHPGQAYDFNRLRRKLGLPPRK